MITVKIPGWGNMEIENIVLDLNGTIATDGKISSEVKLRVLESLDPTKTVAVGNGNNDHLILKEAALGIAVLGEEGMSVMAMQDADIVVKNISEALDLFLKPKRLIATLRE